ncbi:MAG: fused MFS/spermidine synthase [Chitinispirillaceae bacterium]
MLKKDSALVYVFFLLFFISGISGLIYESIWSQYLKQFLGHAAYAQTLVLVIYMGGMALGSWIAAEGSKKARNLLFIYAIVQIILGTSALFFHDLFTAYLDFSFNRIIPALEGRLVVNTYKWITASLIILPQSVLLGATFPLMAGGVLRRFPGLSGYKISFIYFVNTLGASLGVLLSGFYFVKIAGLNGAITAGGVIDIFVGISVLLFCIKDKKPVKTGLQKKTFSTSTKPLITSQEKQNYLYPLLWVSAISAAASFIYEIGWIRMLSLVLGSSTHSFELMLSAFILGLALGSFFIRKRLDKIKNVPRFLSIVQVIMGATALLTLFTYSNMFEFMTFIMNGLRESEQGYVFFNIFSHFISMIIMLPSTICAGMVIPLIIHLLYSRGFGEETIGRVYAVNTFGGIVGVVVAVWLLMPLVGLKFLICIGGFIDIGLGLYILHRFRETRYSFLKIALRPFCVLIVLIALAFSKIDPVKISSGVFRYGSINQFKTVIDHKDGTTASATLFKSGGNYVLSTNGKPDASVGTNEKYSSDEFTMSLLSILPLSIRKQTENAAVIGMGAGMTSHYLLYDPHIEHVDVVEIEPTIVELARKIGHRVSNTFSDKRCNIHYEDAKTFFSTRNESYDLIISEPSNPWVSGISSLFSKEFFKVAGKNLTDDGILVQWFHKYEADMSILVSILKALEQSFPTYEMYQLGSDLLIVASKNEKTDISIKRDVFRYNEIAENLKKMGFESIDDLKNARFADQTLFSPLLKTYNYPSNSDYHPFVDLYAVKHRYLNTSVEEVDELRRFIIPLRKIILEDTSYTSLLTHRKLPEIENLEEIQDAKYIAEELIQSLDSKDTVKNASSASVFVLDYAFTHPHRVTFPQLQSTIVQILEKTLPYLSAEEMKEIWNVIEQKTSGFTFSAKQQQWMNYFRSLCHYDMPSMRYLSYELLPKDTLVDHYSNQMLLSSLFASSYSLKDTSGLDRFWNEYELKHAPPFILKAAKAMTEHGIDYSSHKGSVK